MHELKITSSQNPDKFIRIAVEDDNALIITEGCKLAIAGDQVLHRVRDGIINQRMRFACIGTSLVQQNNAASAGSSVNHETNSRGWQAWMSIFSGGLAKIDTWIDLNSYVGWGTRNFNGYNFGVSAQTSEEILSRLPDIPQEALDGFDVIIVDAGTNDIVNEPASTQARRERICEFFLNKGKQVILLTVLNRATSVWASDSSSRKNHHMVNSLSRYYADKTEGVILYDWNKDWVDYSTAVTVPKPGYSIDGTHFDTPGGYSVGKGMGEFISENYPAVPRRVLAQEDVYDSSINTFGNLAPNPLMFGTSGTAGTGASGDVADDMRMLRTTGSDVTVTCSKEARDDRGAWQVFTFSLAGTNNDVFDFDTGGNISHNLGGKWVRASMEFSVNDTDAIVQLSPYVRDLGPSDGTLLGKNWGLREYNEVPWPQTGGLDNKIIVGDPLYLNPDSTSLSFMVEMFIKGNASIAPVIKVGALELRVVEDPSFILKP